MPSRVHTNGDLGVDRELPAGLLVEVITSDEWIRRGQLAIQNGIGTAFETTLEQPGACMHPLDAAPCWRLRFGLMNGGGVHWFRR